MIKKLFITTLFLSLTKAYGQEPSVNLIPQPAEIQKAAEAFQLNRLRPQSATIMLNAAV